MLNLFRITLLCFVFILFSFKSFSIEKCHWKDSEKVPCITISKTSNTSTFSETGVNKQIITKEDIINSGATDVNDVLKMIPGLNVFQSGPKGQQSSLFIRGTDSNHTLVLLNGIAINDQSATQGLFDFGQDFIQTIQQVEIYKGPSGAHFGPSAIGGAVNFITAIDYNNSVGVSGFNEKNNSIEGDVLRDVDDDNLLISQAHSVIASPSTMCFKPIQMGIPTVILDGFGHIGAYENFYGSTSCEGTGRKLDGQLERGRDIEYIEDNIAGGVDYNSIEIYIDNLINAIGK